MGANRNIPLAGDASRRMAEAAYQAEKKDTSRRRGEAIYQRGKEDASRRIAEAREKQREYNERFGRRF